MAALSAPLLYSFLVIGVDRVVDGDTVDLTLDLGFRQRGTYRLRLADVDTPERGSVGYTEATDYTRQWLQSHDLLGYLLVARTSKTGSFGRWLATIYAVKGDDTRCLNTDLLLHGHAEPYGK